MLPVAEVVWLNQLFQLTDVFGFSQRLIRTSMARLVDEGWVENERVGRVSRYHLTPAAVEESTRADDNIYRQAVETWDGEWVLAFVSSTADTEGSRALPSLKEHLRWRGFADLGNGVLASPNATMESTRELCARLSPDITIPLLTAQFDDIESMVSDGFFRSAFAVDEQERAYKQFISFYGSENVAKLEGPAAFGFRTMLIHDLRRIRLRSALVPKQLLPDPWVGDEAFALAAEHYAKLSIEAAPYLEQVLDTTYPSVVPDRF